MEDRWRGKWIKLYYVDTDMWGIFIVAAVFRLAPHCPAVADEYGWDQIIAARVCVRLCSRGWGRSMEWSC